MSWVLLSDQLLADEPWLEDAFETFDAAHTHDAARWTADWLFAKARSAESEVWLLLREPDIAAYHTFEVGEVELPVDEQARLGLDNPFVLSAHVNWAARHADHEDGGAETARHVQALARDRRLRIVTLDAVDESTAEFWARRGYRESLTGHAGDADAELKRQYRTVS